MRILSVTPYYEPEGGGLERYAHAALRRLAARGHVIQALAFTRTGLASTVHEGVAVTRRTAPFHLGNAPVDPGFAAAVRTAIRDFRPDVVWAHTPVPFPAEAAFFAARALGTPFVLTYHAGRLSASTALLRPLAAMHRMTLQRRMLQGSAQIMAVSPFVRDHALSAERHRVVVVHPGVDSGRFAASPLATGGNVLFVGPLASSYRWKGLDTLWDAFLIVRRRFPGASLTLVGQGDRLPALRRLAARQRIDVRFAGSLTDEALVQAYHAARIVVLPST
ncbi:MAG: glycosyltransferase family 4 protein, partial [Thermoplasmatota archaeon]